MKKQVIIALFALASIGLTSCITGTTVEECKCKKETFDLSTRNSEKGWEFDPIARQYFCHFDVSAISASIYNFGNWNMSREFGKGFPGAYQVQLPMSQFKADTLTEPTVVYYTQYIDYRVGVGYVDIQLTNSDYLYSKENPETMYFRLQANTTVLDLTLAQADWKFDENTNQFYYHFEVPEITSSIYNAGQWSICREYNKGTVDAYQVALPTSCFMTDTLYNNPVVNYTEHIDYRVGIGYVEIQLTNSDHVYLQDLSGKYIKPDDMDFRFQIVH